MKAKLYKVENTFYLKVGETILGTSSNPNLSASIRYSLSLKNCQEIELGYDLDELIDKYCRGNSKIEDDFIKKGFQKAIEILGDKKFSEDDMKEAYSRGFLQQGIKSFNSLIQSLQQTEWDVEIVMDSWFKNGHDGKIVDTNPKLDADGCLILKRVKE